MSMSWVFDKPFSFDEPNFSRIFRFFVIETPVEKCSIRGIPLQYYGWNSKKITNHLKKQITSLSKNWKTIPSKESSKIESIEQDIQKLCNKNKILDEVAERKEVFIHTDMKKNKTMSLFYTIRCAFAHGSFNRGLYFGEYFYFFENKDRGKLRGRIVVKEKTLLQIINIIKNMK